MSKTALCIYGLPKFYTLGYEHIRAAILNCNNGVDVFFHTWFNTEDIGRRWEESPQCNLPPDFVDTNIPSNLIAMYKPKKFVIESQKRDFLTRPVDDYPKTNGMNIAFNTFSMFYSMKRSLQLCRDYETENNFKYDHVINTRFDIAILDRLLVSDKTPGVYGNRILFSDFGHYRPIVGNILIWSSSDNMNNLSNVYDNIDRFVFDDKIIMCGENLLARQFEVISCSLNPVRISAFIIRDRELKDKTTGKVWKS